MKECNMKSYSEKGYSDNMMGLDLSDWGAKSSHPVMGKHSCYHTHPTLLIGGGTLYGGSCINPIIGNADVYIGLDHGMQVKEYLPWELEYQIQQVLYPITDMNAPNDVKTFTKLVDFVCNQLQAGKRVHAGCIGGHGRTGTLFSAVFNVINGDKDSITSVRKLYCKKAVESLDQINFLHKHFGITKVDGTKEFAAKGYNPLQGYSGKSMKGVTDSWPKAGASEIKKKAGTAFANAKKTWNAVASNKKAVGVLF